jgi:hypothetical protein
VFPAGGSPGVETDFAALKSLDCLGIIATARVFAAPKLPAETLPSAADKRAFWGRFSSRPGRRRVIAISVALLRRAQY